LEKGINLFIEEESDTTNESESDNNDIKGQISEDVQISIKLTKSTKNYQLPIKYK
jgi:hypothetical protein